jgi:acyl-coenzyme A thioesterase PaaI-like protein
VSFLAPSLAGKFRAEGRVLQLGKSIAFLEASLFNAEGELTATSTSTAKIVMAKT